MSPSLQTLLASMAVFTLTVVLLAGFVLVFRRLLAASGSVEIVINEQTRLTAPAGQRLVAVLAENGIHLPAACGGRGACGQCRVNIRHGAPPLTGVEASHLSRAQGRAGERLACMITLRDDLSIHLPDSLLAARQWSCSVESTRHITTLMKEMVLHLPPGEHIEFSAGQYVLVEMPPNRVRFAAFDIPEDYRSEWARHQLLQLESECSEPALRAYSLANPPADDQRVVLTVRIALPPHGAAEGTPPGRASSWLFSLVPGAEVPVSGPFGEFRAVQSGREMMLIGGGAGVAPLRSIVLDQLENRQASRRISYWYGARNRREVCYREDWDRLAAGYDNFSWQVALSEPEPGDDWQGPVGFIHSVVFDRYLRDHPAPEEIEYYICGPPLMNLAVLQMLEDLGVDRSSIFLDDFGAES